MSIHFKSVTWKNFLSTGNTPTKILLDRSRSTLIVGSNGAGKSTILDAICFGLYNKPFRKINKPQLINSINNKDLTVEVEFDVSGVPYRVVRGMKPNLFEVYKNGKLIDQAANVRDYQEFLETHVLKMNHRSFCQVVVLGSAGFVPFMQLPASHRREIIEDLLDIQIFSTMNVLLKDKVSKNKDSIQEAKYQEDLTTRKIEMQRNLITRLRAESDSQKNSLSSKIAELEQELIPNREALEELEKEAEFLSGEIADMESVGNKANKIQHLRETVITKISRVEKEIKFYHDADTCPTCKQGISHEFKQTAIQEKEAVLAESNDGLTQMESKYNELTDQYAEMKAMAQRFQACLLKIKGYKTQIASLTNRVEELTESLNSATNVDAEIEKETRLLQDQQKELRTHSRSREKLTNYALILNAASAMLKDGGIKTRIIRQYIPIMNKLINKYLAAMDFFVHFELDEQFNEVIKSRGRDEFSYNSFSEGEKMRINLAILFTWRAIAKMRNTASTNLLMMDEVFDSSLDVSGTEEFIKIIEELTKDTNVFVISHKADNLFDKFHSVIRFEKHKNFSRMA